MSQPARILIVDDEATIRLTLGAMLQRTGYDVTSAESGAEAVALLERQVFDLLLVDLKMPGMDGMQVAAAARQRQSDRTTADKHYSGKKKQNTFARISCSASRRSKRAVA